MSTTLNPGQQFFLHLQNSDDTPYTIPAGATVEWRAGNDCITVTPVVGLVDALVVAISRGSANVTCRVIKDGIPTIVLRELVQVEQPDEAKLTAEAPF